MAIVTCALFLSFLIYSFLEGQGEELEARVRKWEWICFSGKKLCWQLFDDCNCKNTSFYFLPHSLCFDFFPSNLVSFLQSFFPLQEERSEREKKKNSFKFRKHWWSHQFFISVISTLASKVNKWFQHPTFLSSSSCHYCYSYEAKTCDFQSRGLKLHRKEVHKGVTSSQAAR